MSRFLGRTSLAVALLATAACGGGSAEPDAGVTADGGPDAAGPPDGAPPPDAALPDAGPPPPPAHPPRLAFVSAGVPYLVEWHDGVAQPPVALSDRLVGASLTWSEDGHLLMLSDGAGLLAIAFDDTGPLPVQTLPSSCATCWITDWGLSPDGRHAYMAVDHDPAFPSDDVPHDLYVVDIAEDGSFGVPQRIAFGSYNGPLFFPAQWSPDSTSLIWRFYIETDDAGLYVTRVDGAMPVTSGLATTLLHWDDPTWCEDSNRALFIAEGAPAQPGTTGLSSADLSGASPGSLTDLDASFMGLLWASAPDCRAVVFQDLNLDGRLYAVDTRAPTPGEPVELGSYWPGQTPRNSIWSPDSRWFVASKALPDPPDTVVLVGYDMAQGTLGPSTDLGIMGSATTRWRDDSKQLLVRATAAAQPPATYLVNVSDAGFAAPAMLTFPQNALDPSFTAHPWSSDGHWLVYSGTSSGQVFGGVIDSSSGSAMDLGHVSPGPGSPWAPGTNLLALEAATGNPDVGRLQVVDLSTPGAAPVSVDDDHTADAWAWQP